MSWLDCRSMGQYNRTGYLTLEDGTKAQFSFAYRGTRLTSVSDAVTGLEIERRMSTIDTPSRLKFTLHSTITIEGEAYVVGDCQDVEPEDQNGKFRKTAIRVQRLNVLKAL